MSPATALQAAREEKLAEWFENRHWRVLTEIDGIRAWPVGAKADDPESILVRFRKGSFVVDKPGYYASPLGHPGRNGVLIRETDAEGADLPGKVTTQFGLGTLRSAVAKYGAVIRDLPEN
jgi:hypothetical protein